MCCVLPAIKELAKPANVPCNNLTDKGCGIYDKRPQVCRDFECHWLDGSGEVRPDVMGAYTTRMPDSNGWSGAGGILVHIDPTRFGRHEAVQKAIEKAVSAGGEAMMFRGESRRIATNNPRTLSIAALRGLQDQDGRTVTVEMV